MKRLVLILRKVAKFVFRLISSRLSSRGVAFEFVSKLLEMKFVSKLLENAVSNVCIAIATSFAELRGFSRKFNIRAISSVIYSYNLIFVISNFLRELE